MSEIPYSPVENDLSNHCIFLKPEEDKQWLSSYGFDSDQLDFYALDTLVSVGSIDDRLLRALGERNDILRARETFFTLIGLDQTAPAMRVYLDDSTAVMPFSNTPLADFVVSQRIIIQNGLDPAWIINTYPAVIGFSPERIQELISLIKSYIEQQNWDGSIQELVERYPKLLEQA